MHILSLEECSVPVHLPLPDVLRVLVDLLEDGGEDGNQQVEQHYVGNDEVDGEEDEHKVVVELHLLAEGVLVADRAAGNVDLVQATNRMLYTG